MYIPPMLLFFLLLWLWGSFRETDARLKALEPVKVQPPQIPYRVRLKAYRERHPAPVPDPTCWVTRSDLVAIPLLLGLAVAVIWLCSLAA
jgi:hypothetical protein